MYIGIGSISEGAVKQKITFASFTDLYVGYGSVSEGAV